MQVEYLRNYERLQDKTYVREFPVKYPPGTASEAPSWLSRLPLAPVLSARWFHLLQGLLHSGRLLSCCQLRGGSLAYVLAIKRTMQAVHVFGLTLGMPLMLDTVSMVKRLICFSCWIGHCHSQPLGDIQSKCAVGCAGVVKERVYKLGVHVTVAEGEPADAMDTS